MRALPAGFLRSAKNLVTGVAETTEIVDVWSRTKRKYRRRSVILLLLNACLFVGLGSFTYWLRTGEPYWPFAAAGYGQRLWETFNPIAENPVTLSDFLLFPISLEHVPLQIVVVGLLLATLISSSTCRTMMPSSRAFFAIQCSTPVAGLIG